MTPYVFQRKGRSWATLIAVLCTWAACMIAWLVFSAAPWILVIVLLFTLPALWDLWSAPTAGFEIDAQSVSWHSGSLHQSVMVSQIDHIRLVTRLDLTVRAAVVLHDGDKRRVPAESTPPSKDLETSLNAAGLRVERHHFTFL